MQMTGPEFKARREAMGLSQAQMAARLPRPLRTLQGWERGKPIPPDYHRTIRDLERELAAGVEPA